MNKISNVVFITFATVLLTSYFQHKNVVPAYEKENTCVRSNASLSDEELREFYRKNNVAPCSPNQTATSVLRGGDIENHLKTRFSEFPTWNLEANSSKDVSAIYGANPVEQNEYASFMQLAKANSKLKNNVYVGCGNIALYSELEYLANNLGYSQLISNKDSFAEKVALCTDVFNMTNSYDSNSEITQELASMKISFSSGTLVFPNDLISAARQLLYDYNINNGIGPEELDSSGKNVELIKVYGDVIPAYSSPASRTNELIKSINKGMPVIWWTTNNVGDFSNHYMTIFGYETWKGTDANGNEIEHVFFRLNFNWNETSVAYMDSDLLEGFIGGFIFFEENIEKTFIKPSDYAFPQAYCMGNEDSSIVKDSNVIGIERKRTGYINEDGFAGTGDWFLTMSCKKKDVNEAYLSYHVQKPINFIYFDVRQWAAGDARKCNFLLEYKDKNNCWTTGIDFFQEKSINYFSYDKYKPEKYRYDFPYGVCEFRFALTNNESVSSTRNKGRIVIGTVGIVFASYKTSDPKLIVSVFSDNNNSSSFMNFEGHSYIQVYNQSTQDQIIGKYILHSFEGVTIGLWGNNSAHTGVFYNLEYYLALTTTENESLSSTSSSSSGSSSSATSAYSSGSSQSGSSQWSAGSLGAAAWLTVQSMQSFIVSYSTGRASLTKSIELNQAVNITNILNSHNDEWFVWYNCSHLATDIWNTISPEDTIVKDWIQTPKTLMDRIKEKNGHQIDRCLIGDRSRVGYFDDDVFVRCYE